MVEFFKFVQTKIDLFHHRTNATGNFETTVIPKDTKGRITWLGMCGDEGEEQLSISVAMLHEGIKYDRITPISEFEKLFKVLDQ